MTLADLNQWWWPQPRSIRGGERFPAPPHVSLRGPWHPMLADDLARLVEVAASPTGFTARVTVNPDLPAQHYQLAIDATGATVTAGDDAGAFYGQLTLIQYLALHRDKPIWPALDIADEPAFDRRGAMVDLGRTVSNLPMLKQLVRIFARLRYNELHLRLFDDELCSVRFDGLPFGRENPYALTAGDLAELDQHARQHHVTLVPEVESWGHVGSVTFHRPELRGGPGMFAGSSFIAGPESAALVGELARRVVAALPDAPLHLGFDEANWVPHASAASDYSPADYLHDIVRQLPASGRELRIWADHAGRPLPDALRGRVVLQPWQYWIKHRALLDRALDVYARGESPWMMTLGQSHAQVRGAYRATRYFCRRATGIANLRGVTIAQWGWNDWSGQFLTPFAGAYYAWNPLADSVYCDEEDSEVFDQQVMPKLLWWRSLCRDAHDLDGHRGPLVWNGRYVGGERHGDPVAPTVTAANSFPHRAYLDTMIAEEAAVPAGELP